MIIEHVHLSIKSGQSEAFLEAFEQAKHIVYPMEGFNAVQLIKHATDPHHYILMIFWDEIETIQKGLESLRLIKNGKLCSIHFMTQCRRLSTTNRVGY